jgi:hypothetical protein
MTGALTLSGAPTADLNAATKKYVDDLSGGLGVSQTWQAVTRTGGTVYQNTTGKPIGFAFTGRGSSAVRTLQLSIDNVNWLDYARTTSSSEPNTTLFAVIPSGLYYKFDGAVSTVLMLVLR